MKGYLSKVANSFFPIWSQPLFVFFISLLAYGTFAAFKYSPTFTSTYPYYNYLADAFLHGQLSLRILPPNLIDLVYFNDKYFLYWPPMPAIALMPFVLLFGIGFSDIAFTVVLGAINVLLISILLRCLDENNIVQISPSHRGILVLFFTFGTVHTILAPNGRVWFTAQLMGLFFVLLAYIFSTKSQRFTAFFLSGLMLGFAFLTRNNLLFTGIWLAYFLLNKYRHTRITKLVFFSLLAGIFPIILSIGGYLLYNQLRFGNPTDLGLDYHLMNSVFQSNYLKYGAFNFHYVPINFYYQYIHYPFPFHEDTYMGGSLFLLSPMFFAVFPALIKHQPRLSVLALLLTILVTNIPILFLMGTGWIQIGPRYTLDFIIPMLILTACGMNYFKDRILLILLFLSIAQYTYALFLPI